MDAAAAAWQVGKDLLILMKRHVSYLFCYRRNLVELKRKIEELRMLRNDVQGRVDADGRSGNVVGETVQGWLASAQVMEADAAKLEDGVEENKGCFSRWLPTWCSHYSLGKGARQKMALANELQTEGRNFSSVSYPRPPPSLNSMFAGDFMEFTSRKSVMEQIMNALRDERKNVVGVYGMGGMGKTMMMKEVGKCAKNENLFSNVVMVIVSQKPEVRKIQYEIADQLGMLFSEGCQSVRAGRLLERLKETKVLMILDDVWERLNLIEIGIPCVDNHENCKVIITTRSRDVCNAMESKEMVEVGVLSEQESWNLFGKYAGNSIDSPTRNAIAREIVKECEGLPLAIVTTGTTLRNKDPIVWADALTKLKNAMPIDNEHKKIFSCLLLSYNHLETEEIKTCFLFCSLFPEDHNIEIEVLMTYGVAEDLFTDVETLKEARDRVHSLVEKLKASCLLLDGDKDGCVKMHDVVRDVAILIASKEHGFHVRSGRQLKEWPGKELENCQRLSLMYNKITKLTNKPKCPKLQMLLLQHNYRLKVVRDDFFEGLKALRVLDLRRTCILVLPTSLRCLPNLRSLCLDECGRLQDISAIGSLTKLEVLSLSSAQSIRELPKEMSNLVNLKLLNLMETFYLERVPQNVISKLSHLEELHTGYSFSGWEIEGKEDAGNARFAEVASLAHLAVLYIHARNVEILSREFPGPWKNLTRFRLSVGSKYSSSYCQRSVHLENVLVPSPVSNWFKVLSERACDLSLVCCNGLRNVCDLGAQGFSSLESLYIKKCNEIEHFISSRGSIDAFKKLEKLQLHCMENLKAFSDGEQLASGSLERLKIFNVYECRKLNCILSSDLLQGVQTLECLEVEDCKELNHVFSFDKHVHGYPSLLPGLRKMNLEDLPKLTSIWNGLVPFGSLGNLKELNISQCKSLRSLLSFTLARNLHRLEVLRISECDKLEKIISYDEEDMEFSLGIVRNSDEKMLQLVTFQNLREVSISSCKSLKKLMSPSIAQGFTRLEELSLCFCDGIEEIIAEEEEAASKDQQMLPQLMTLKLKSLPRMTNLYRQGQEAGVICWPSLACVEVLRCPNLKRLPLGPENLLKLEEIKGEKEWFKQLEWEEGSIKSQLESIFKVAYM